MLKDFRDGRITTLIATDVAARGLDIDAVGYVINYDFPHTVEDYVHRIGRTGRADNAGTAYRFVTPPPRVEHFAIFKNLLFAITSGVLRILMEHIESICSLES